MNIIIGIALLALMVYCAWSAVDFEIHYEDFKNKDTKEDNTED